MAAIELLTPRALLRIERREAILEAAMRTVSEGGIDALSTAALAKRVGFTPGALYRYFDSMDALLGELATRILASLDETLSRAAESAPADRPLLRLARIAAALEAFARRERYAFGLISVLLGDPRVLVTDAKHAEAVLEATVAVLAPAVDALAAAIELGELNEAVASELALGLFASLYSALILQKQESRGVAAIDAHRLFIQLFNALLVGWGADPERVRELRPELDPPQARR